MCLEMSAVATICIRNLLTIDGFKIRIWFFSVRVPVLDHVVPFLYGLAWKCGSELIVIFLLL